MDTTILEVKGLSKKYGDSFAIRDINMIIESGEIYGFVGENGAGKTTLMKIISGLVSPTSGSITLMGKQNKVDLIKARKQLGVLIEMPALYPHLNGLETLTFYYKVYGMKDKNRINEVLELVSLSSVASKKISEYSLGMRQRLGLAIALLNYPKFLVLDEPINGLDPIGIIEMRKILMELVHEQGITILISSHILSELQLLATKFGFIHQGRLVKELTLNDLTEVSKSQLCVKTSDPYLAMSILQEQLRLDRMILSETGEILIPKGVVELESLLSILVQHNIHIEGINLSTANLENYYMELIGVGSK
ncbi:MULTISPECIES: ABC transporter ATP-binding protein [unclassified Paenibacillus]|uniref:ABC transporter ATP-binding protein n=1 Tax=unclassified Paenibacillus TaxID=185978 RepID=UPI0024059C28|nr:MULTISPECIES: ABC transporter ATP-binding protein [unclassified Paenibacillus]MDF9845323.1 ABC-2 type transport system ATP-binding protein [Paenibacillus sp. PastF-2]MDF9851905.1 ABC-2 type transport system ATP-binding protein [Paenibacillus sp. PastM-2]MDF9858481.1 ABC-2 type transport system ATP-binding protein [Paenibacillus sp. PastF-1]MDH6483735.1 ABC-2 type transport system ATP-binding protein [Paenibacillus sp. PastH-2]MDH6511130.1 ABC-2 type transport system ATP-binding protein [Pae